MSLKQRPYKSIQFGTKYDAEKARRLEQEVAGLWNTLNAVIRDFDAIDAEDSGKHELASETGLGPDHTVSGLTAGHVLRALAADQAAFGAFALDDLSDVDASGAAGVVLTKQANGTWEGASLPDLTGLADPGGNRLVWWNEDENALDFMRIGDGLTIAGDQLRVQASAIQHGLLAGLTFDHHPQYTQWSQAESIVGAWDFEEPVDFVDSDTGERVRTGMREGFFISGIDTDGGAHDVLAVDFYAEAMLDLLTLGNAADLLRTEHWGSFYIPLDDAGIYIGEAGDTGLWRDETNGYLSNVEGTLYIESDEGVHLTTNLLEAFTPLISHWDTAADTDAGGWAAELTANQLRLASLNDDGSIGEAWCTVQRVQSSIDVVDLNATELRWNGALLLTEYSNLGLGFPISAPKTAAYTVQDGDGTIPVDATAGAVTVTLPAAATNPQRILKVKKIDASANAVTLDGFGTETIDGALTKATTTQWAVLSVQSNGTGWYLL